MHPDRGLKKFSCDVGKRKSLILSFRHTKDWLKTNECSVLVEDSLKEGCSGAKQVHLFGGGNPALPSGLRNNKPGGCEGPTR